MGVGAASLGIEGEADDGRADGAQLFEHRHDVAVESRLLGEDVAGVEAEAKVVDAVVFDAEESPDHLFLELAYHALEQTYFSRHLFAGVAGAGLGYDLAQLGFQRVDAVDAPNLDEIAHEAVGEAAAPLVGVARGDVDQAVVGVLAAFEFIAFLEEIWVAEHFDAPLFDKTQRIGQGVYKEVIGDGVEARGHDGEVRLVGLVARYAVDMRQETEHDVVVVGAGVEKHLAARRGRAEFDLMFERVDNRLNGVVAEVGNQAAIFVAAKLVDGDLVGIFARAVAVFEHGAIGFRLSPGR